MIHASNGSLIEYKILSDKENQYLGSATGTQTYTENNIFTNVGTLYVANYGLSGKNDFPLELRENVKYNHILPELLEKQVRYLYGSGPMLYKEEIVNVGTAQMKVKVPVYDESIEAWLNSWELEGFANFKEYLINCIREFYYTEGIFSKYVFRKSTKVNNPKIAALEYQSSKDCRFATDKAEYGSSIQKINPKDFKYILVGDWSNASADINRYKRYTVLNKKDIGSNGLTMNYRKNDSFGEDLYSYPVYYLGLKDWIRGLNMAPKYINSFLKNSVNIRLHVSIPNAWVNAAKSQLMDIIDQNRINRQNGTPVIEKYNNITLPEEYSDQLLNQVIDSKLSTITELMSGEGDNQGKMFSSVAFRTEHGIEDWEFKEIPSKYKEFIESVLSFKKNAVEAILEGKGIDASISNVSQQGVISKSGSDAYYNYMIYMNSLQIPEDVVTADLNFALKVNFPGKNLKIGFQRDIIQKQQDVNVSQRITA